mgnify:CR=1 FL=1
MIGVIGVKNAGVKNHADPVPDDPPHVIFSQGVLCKRLLDQCKGCI